MAVKRQKRINLDGYDPSWSGCYILLHTKSWNEIQEFRKDFDSSNKKKVKLEKELKKLKRSLEKASDDGLYDQLEAEVEKVEADLEKHAEQELAKMQSIISGNFVGGLIFDFDEKKQRELKREDIFDFDVEVISDLVNSIIGTLDKKK